MQKRCVLPRTPQLSDQLTNRHHLGGAGYILLAFTVLYAFEAGYFTGMLFAAEDIRGYDYRCTLLLYHNQQGRRSSKTRQGQHSNLPISLHVCSSW